MTVERFGISARSFDMIVGLFGLYEQIEQALIFGSRSMGNPKNGSDIDIALVGDDIPLMDIQGKLGEVLPIPYHIDLVDYKKIKEPSLRKHIDQYGKILYKKK